MKNLFVVIVLASLGLSAFAQRTVLIESFTQASCGPCYAQDPAFQAIVTPNMDKIAIIKWHVWWPGADPMYDYSSNDVDWRTGNFYGINSVPTVRISDAWSGQPQALTQAIIDTEYAQPQLFEIFIDEAINGIDVEIDVTITALADWSGANFLKCHTIMIEDEVHFTSPPGSNPVTEYHWVMRKMLPNRAGRDVTPMVAGEQLKFTETYTVDTAEIDPHELRTVVFIQDRVSKEIHQVLLGPDTTGQNFIATCVNPPIIDTLLTSDETVSGQMDGVAAVAVLGNADDYTYSWSAPNSSNTNSITGLGAGQYTVTVTDSTGCETVTDFWIASLASGIGTTHELKSVRVFPNPVNERAVFTFPEKIKGQLNIFSLDGKQIESINLKNQDEALLERNDLRSGTYLFETQGSSHHSGKFVIK